MTAIQEKECPPQRAWAAQLDLAFALKGKKSTLVDISHEGPLRVLKPFYPEADGTCHVYLLHPPGGLVAGDQLSIRASLGTGVKALLTTPSAGKVYGVKQLAEAQDQNLCLSVGDHAVLECLPQETIIFNGASAQLKTRIDLSETGKVFVWDIVKLGRSASGESFNNGVCRQALEIWCGKKPRFVERNIFEAGCDLQSASWGLRGANTSATLCSNIQTTRDMVDEWLAHLTFLSRSNQSLWGLSQKNEFFLARYLGNSLIDCRRGFEYLWRQCRPLLVDKPSIIPRIWRT